MISIIRNYTSVKSPISHKYLNHGIGVPTQKCSNYNNHFLNSYKISVCNFFKVRAYSTCSPNDKNDYGYNQFIPAVIYENAFSMKKAILEDNDGKAGIYMLTNKVTGDIYFLCLRHRRGSGQSIDLRKRFLKYFNLSYINSRNELVISRALIKYGWCHAYFVQQAKNFSLTVLEYCDKFDLDVREQHYFDTLNPKYNTQKIAGGSSRGLILSEETKNKISKALKGVYPSSAEALPKFR